MKKESFPISKDLLMAQKPHSIAKLAKLQMAIEIRRLHSKRGLAAKFWAYHEQPFHKSGKVRLPTNRQESAARLRGSVAKAAIWPADGEWCAERGLHGSEVCAPPRAAVAFPRVSGLRAVVASEDDDGIVFDPGLFDRIEDLARTIVHLGEAIGPIAVSGFAGELPIRQCWHVKERK